MFSIDHLGIAVKSLSEARAFYERLGLKVMPEEVVQQEKVRLAMVPIGESRIELLEPTADDSPIARYLAKRGEGLHHVAYRVDDIDRTLDQLRDAGVALIDSEARIGIRGSRVAFVHPKSTGNVLTELVEPAGDHG
jgi:methylmalonyl-CoA epimerase